MVNHWQEKFDAARCQIKHLDSEVRDVGFYWVLTVRSSELTQKVGTSRAAAVNIPTYVDIESTTVRAAPTSSAGTVCKPKPKTAPNQNRGFLCN